jgi:hypothetical protein
MFVWRYLDATGEDAGSSGEFPDQGAAENWLRESWEELLESGVEAVELAGPEGGVYRMALRAST